MGDFDPAIAVAVALAVEEETDVLRRKRAKMVKRVVSAAFKVWTHQNTT